MAVSALKEQYVLDEKAAKKIASTPPVKLSKSNVFNDLDLNDEERIAHAFNIIKSRKCK